MSDERPNISLSYQMRNPIFRSHVRWETPYFALMSDEIMWISNIFVVIENVLNYFDLCELVTGLNSFCVSDMVWTMFWIYLDCNIVLSENVFTLVFFMWISNILNIFSNYNNTHVYFQKKKFFFFESVIVLSIICDSDSVWSMFEYI